MRSLDRNGWPLSSLETRPRDLKIPYCVEIKEAHSLKEGEDTPASKSRICSLVQSCASIVKLTHPIHPWGGKKAKKFSSRMAVPTNFVNIIQIISKKTEERYSTASRAMDTVLGANMAASLIVHSRKVAGHCPRFESRSTIVLAQVEMYQVEEITMMSELRCSWEDDRCSCAVSLASMTRIIPPTKVPGLIKTRDVFRLPGL